MKTPTVILGGGLLITGTILYALSKGIYENQDFFDFGNNGSGSGTYGVNPKDETPAPKKDTPGTNVPNYSSDISYELVNPNLAIATKNGVIVGGQSSYTNQSLTSGGAKKQIQAVSNPIAKIALNPSLSKKESDAKIVNNYQNTTKQSTTLSSSQISSFNNLTKKKVFG